VPVSKGEARGMRGFNCCIEVRAESRQGFDTVAAQPTQPERVLGRFRMRNQSQAMLADANLIPDRPEEGAVGDCLEG
jgi:hypothetical protein